MKVIGLPLIKKFSKNNAQARKPLRLWLEKTKKAHWKTSADVKATFGSVDNPRGNEYIFNVGGNKYRLIALVVIMNGTVLIKQIMTHEEYTKKYKMS